MKPRATTFCRALAIAWLLLTTHSTVWAQAGTPQRDNSAVVDSARVAPRFGTVRVATRFYWAQHSSEHEAPWPHVYVTLRAVDSRITRRAQTDANGRASFVNVKPGTYVVTALGKSVPVLKPGMHFKTSRADSAAMYEPATAVTAESRRPFRVRAGRTVVETLRIVGVPPGMPAIRM